MIVLKSDFIGLGGGIIVKKRDCQAEDSRYT